MQRSLASAAPPHAYLFAGPEGVGKRTLAVWLAQALNCERGVGAQQPRAPGDATAGETGAAAAPLTDGAPCGECRACTRIAAGIHAGVQTVTVEAAEEIARQTAASTRLRTGIGVEQVRDVGRAVALRPFEGRFRVVTIDPADGMTVEAQNAFLKTLEEPPPYAVFVLVAAGEEALLPTIRSRCQRVEFRPVSASEIEAALGAQGLDAERARLLARLSRGRAGWALAAARDPSQLERRREALEQASALGGMSVVERLDLAERLAGEFRQEREPAFALLEEWLGWWRDVLLVQAGAADAVVNVDVLPDLAAAAARCPREDVIAFVQALLDAREQLQANVQARLALEALLLSAPAEPAASRR